jgi:hypothetical protein
MTATVSSSGALLFERRLPRLAVDRLDDFEREADLPFLPFASTLAEKGHATEMMSRNAVKSASGLEDCKDIVLTLKNNL